MAIKTYPLNNIDYQSEDAELFHCTRTSGIYASGHFPISVSGADNDINIGKGIGWIKNTEFSGKVFASKENTTLNAGVPDASFPRIDSVIVRFDANQNETYFTIKQGSVGSSPTPPQVERSEYIYELHLYHIRRNPGATSITPGDITDLRMDANYCGLMADSVTQVDMSAINSQVRSFISDWAKQIANVTDGKLIESPEYPGCYYRMNNGIKEWLNPPMIEGEYYPTTKRLDGKRVYIQLFKARLLSGSVTLEGVEKIVSLSAIAERIWSEDQKIMFQVPAFELPSDSPMIQRVQIYYHDNKIVFQGTVSKGSYDLYITVEFTKEVEDDITDEIYQYEENLVVNTNGNVSSSGDTLEMEIPATVSSDGGEYVKTLIINGVSYKIGAPTDTSLSQSGAAADAKVVGDALKSYINDVDTLIGGNG